MGRQDIVNYCGFSTKIFLNGHKRLIPEISRNDQREMFVKVPFRDRLVCFADFVGMTLIACLQYSISFPLIAVFRFLLPLHFCFTRVFLSTLFSAVLSFFTANNFCNFWRNKLQQVSNHTFCSRTDKFTQQQNSVSPYNLCK